MTNLTVEQIAKVSKARAEDIESLIFNAYAGMSDEEVYASLVRRRALHDAAVARDAAQAAEIKQATGLYKGVMVRLKSDGTVWEVYADPKGWDGDYMLQLHTMTPYATFSEALASDVEIVA